MNEKQIDTIQQTIDHLKNDEPVEAATLLEQLLADVDVDDEPDLEFTPEELHRAAAQANLAALRRGER